MSILQQVPEKMQMILQTVPDEVAPQTGCVKRRRKLTGSALAQTLVFGWLEHPEASYQHLTETAATLGIQVSRQALAQRLTPETAEMFKRTLEAAIPQMLEVASPPEALPLLEAFTRFTKHAQRRRKHPHPQVHPYRENKATSGISHR